MSWTAPFDIVNPTGKAGIVIVCDHASNAVPQAIGDLGVAPQDMQRHIAWDIGATPIARRLAEAFDAPAILCGTSRLVIDCNRKLDDPTLIPLTSDGTVIPGNAGLTPAQRRHRIDAYFTTYHDACRRVVAERLAKAERPLFLSIHSMTDRMNGGGHRPWEISLSSNEDRRATDPVLVALRRMPDLVVGDNEPYDMDPRADYSTPEHALAHGLDYLQVEFRQDRVAAAEGQERFAMILARAIRDSGILR
ncbi:N-formylglutamate amidohydrolase [Taklimakanibacter deserti]|uniref:N-formylglutamate amidohydrolase n=1 Tax=Taklimakanibacter deserti TaxID=2267839 RepID=UPI0013C504A6